MSWHLQMYPYRTISQKCTNRTSFPPRVFACRSWGGDERWLLSSRPAHRASLARLLRGAAYTLLQSKTASVQLELRDAQEPDLHCQHTWLPWNSAAEEPGVGCGMRERNAAKSHGRPARSDGCRELGRLAGYLRDRALATAREEMK